MYDLLGYVGNIILLKNTTIYIYFNFFLCCFSGIISRFMNTIIKYEFTHLLLLIHMQTYANTLARTYEYPVVLKIIFNGTLY